MKNLVVYQDISFPLLISHGEPIEDEVVDLAVDYATSTSFALTRGGFVVVVPQLDSPQSLDISLSIKWNLNDFLDFDDGLMYSDNHWFSIQYLADSNTLVCLSKIGNIVSIHENQDTGMKNDFAEHEGAIDGGISSAKWSPDESVLVILTNNDTMIQMSSSFELLQEIEIQKRVPRSLSDISWSGDGQYFTILFQDAVDQITKVRYYSRDFAQLHDARHVAEGDQGVIRSIGSSVAISPSGSICAIPTVKARRLHICLLERNGLSHGGFDIQVSGDLLFVLS